MAYFRSLLSARQLILSPSYQPLRTTLQSRCVTIKSTPATPPPKLTHEEKNEGIRPMSPHLLIYKPQLTSMMSISHRIAGMAMTGYATILAFGSFTTSFDVCCIADAIKSINLPYLITYVMKYILAFPVVYHLFNGIRHLMWDTGKGLQMKEVYLSGYIVLALTILFSIIISK